MTGMSNRKVMLAEPRYVERPEFVVERLSAHPQDFLVRPDTAWLDFPRRRAFYEDTAGLFPGFGLLGLALAGAVIGWRSPAWRRPTAFFAAAARTSLRVKAIVSSVPTRSSLLPMQSQNDLPASLSVKCITWRPVVSACFSRPLNCRMT